MGRQQQDRLAELRSRPEQPVELPGLLETVRASQGGNDALLATAVFPVVLDDLEIDAISRLLPAKEHGSLEWHCRVSK